MAIPYIVIIALTVGYTLKRKGHGRGIYFDALSITYVLSCMYIWFFISAQGMSEHALLPGKTWYVAYKYGLINTEGMYVQFILNTIMLIPAGILIRVYSKKMLLYISVGAVFMVEVIQGALFRTFDADDLLAYLSGLFIGCLIYRCYNWKSLSGVHRFQTLGLIGIMTAIYILPFACESTREYGYVYIESPVPSMVVVDIQTDVNESMPIYKRKKESIEEKALVLSNITGITGELDMENGAAIYQDSETRLQIAKDCTWVAHWGNRSIPSESYAEQDIKQLVEDELIKYGYRTASLTLYFDADYQLYSIEAVISEKDKCGWLMGNVKIEMYSNGLIQKMYSDVAYYELIDKVDCLSVETAVKRLCNFPARKVDGCFEVFEAEIIYKLNDTGDQFRGEFLIPCWLLNGELNKEEWYEVVNAIEYAV